MSKRVFRWQEFSAHGNGSAVNCLRIGRKSGRVMVTGGEDKMVNMWAIGKAGVIMSLAGHTTPVECVCFDALEEIVVAGSAGGTLKLWDLDEQKVVRTFNGHKSNCISVDFHPFGEFFASGSLDTQLKIWDIRRKGCIQTYTGHSGGINVIRFSPDGRWVISGGQDGVVKLWDLTAGKLLHDLKAHTAAVTSLEFHPHEFLLATGSHDRRVNFWDLETFETVSASDPDTSRISALAFSPDGGCLLSAHSDSLKVVGWEPTRTLDSISVNWKEVADVNITADQFIACSVNQSLVTVWVVHLQKLRPFAKDQVIFDPPSNVKSSLNMEKTSEALKVLQGINLEHSGGFQPHIVGETQARPAIQHSREAESPTTQSSGSNGSNMKSSEEIIAEILKPHVTMSGILNSRYSNIRLIRSLWGKGDVREAVESMARLNDPAVVVDILNIIGERGNIFTLDMCVTLLPVLNDLLLGEYEEYVLTALSTTKLLVSSFGPYIKTTLDSPPSSGVDLSRDERLEKCNYCYNALQQIRIRLDSTGKSGKVGQFVKEIVQLLNSMAINTKNS